VTLSSAQRLGDHDYSVSVNVELVQLPVSDLDKHGFPVRGLQQQHFMVYEDKVLQEISLFKQEEYSVQGYYAAPDERRARFPRANDGPKQQALGLS
jgi:hypothetical protein